MCGAWKLYSHVFPLKTRTMADLIELNAARTYDCCYPIRRCAAAGRPDFPIIVFDSGGRTDNTVRYNNNNNNNASFLNLPPTGTSRGRLPTSWRPAVGARQEFPTKTAGRFCLSVGSFCRFAR